MTAPTTVADPAPDTSVSGTAADSSGDWVVERHRVRRPLGVLFWLAAVVVPLGLTAVVAVTRTPVLETSLHSEAMAALHGAGLVHVHVAVDGRQLVAKVPTGTRAAKVEAALQSLPGVQSVRTVDVYASKAEATACARLQQKVDRATGGEQIPFPGASTRLSSVGVQMLRSVGRLLSACSPASVVVGGHSDSHTPNGATISLARAHAMIQALHGQGIALRRMAPRGYGDEFPVTDGSTPAAQARNQRGSIAVQGQ